MVLDIMSAPPLPSRNAPGIRSTPSIRGRPLPPPPQDSLHPSHSIQKRALPPTPPAEVTNSDHVHATGSQTLPRRVIPSSTSNAPGHGFHSKRPLPAAPSEQIITTHRDQNDRRTLSPKIHRAATLQRTATKSSPTNNNSSTGNRPLPPPPNGMCINADSNTLLPPVPARKLSLPPHVKDEGDFEQRFYFHEVKDFPPPDEFSGQEKKYQSKVQNKKKPNRRRKKTSPT